MRGFKGVLVVVFAVVACGTLALGAGSASALNTHLFSGSFGSAGSGAGQVLLSAASSNVAGSGVAVDAGSGDVYVADTGNFRVDEFSSAGVFVRAWGWGVADGLPAFEVCTLSCQQGLSGSAAGQFVNPVFIAVDNSAGPSAGDVYVGDVGDNRVTKFSAAGAVVGAWGVGGQLDGSTTGAGVFGALAGVAVGPGGTGTLYVLNTASGVFEFEQDGTFATEFEVARGTEPHGLAVDAAGDIFKVNGDLSVEEITGANSDVGQVTPEGVGLGGSTNASGLAVGASGDLYVAEPGGVAHYAFAEPGVVSEPGGRTCTLGSHAGCVATDVFGAGTLSGGSGVGFDPSSGGVFVDDASAGLLDVFAPLVLPDVASGSAGEVHPTSAKLEGSVNPSGVQLSDCRFDYGTSTAYGQSAPCVPAAGSIPADSSPHSVTAGLAGLTPGVTYHFRLQASNANCASCTSFGEDATFATPPPPSITGANATGLTATSADLNAQINPNGSDTSYRFEWGTSMAYGTSVPVPDADIGSGTGSVAVTTHLAGLSANATYHWRVIASNPSGTTTGVDHTFVYETNGGGLPDNRAYEMVSPPQKNGAVLGTLFGSNPSVSDDGSRVMIESIQCFAGSVSCTASRADSNGEPFEFSRTSGGWAPTPLAPPALPADATTRVRFSAEGDTALFTSPTAPFGEDDFLARRPDGSFVDIGPSSPPALGANGSPSGSQAMTADLSHLVFENQGHGWPFDATQGLGRSLYEYAGSGSAPVLVGVSGGAGSTDLISACETLLGEPRGGDSRGLSADGGTVFFTAMACASGSGVNAGVAVPADALYARIGGSRTVLVSGRSPLGCTGVCLGSPAGAANFRGASADGSKVFFLDTQQLTDTASEDNHSGDTAAGATGCEETTGVNGCNLYEYDFTNPAGRNLLAVSAGDTSGAGPRVQGVVAFALDGSHVYFVAKGVLTGAANSEGTVARNGADNLYVFERDAGNPEGRVAFIASLPGSDRRRWTPPIGANVTPDGRFLVFASRGLLTSEDTSALGAAQVFRYDAVTGALVRISIGENGFADNGNAPGGAPCLFAFSCPEDASIVSASGFFQASPVRTDPTMSHDGAFVFFESPVGLTPGALNDVQIGSGQEGVIYEQNVYEWHEGHVYLISDGRDVSAAGKHVMESGRLDLSSVHLIASDGSGGNVFFQTADSLVGQDTDTQVDIYDARVCTSGDPCIAPPTVVSSCEGEACRGAPGGVPSLGAAVSSVFAGAGNPAPPHSPAAVKKKNKEKVKQKRARHKKGKVKRKRGSGRAVRSGGRVKRGRS